MEGVKRGVSARLHSTPYKGITSPQNQIDFRSLVGSPTMKIRHVKTVFHGIMNAMSFFQNGQFVELIERLKSKVGYRIVI